MLNYFFDISDLSKDQLEKIIFNKVNDNDLSGKNIGCIYEKPSTRTRLSFIVGINELNGKVVEIKFEDLNFSREETLEDTFRALGCYLDGLIFRTTSHKKLIIGKNFFNKPIINALSDKSHPCQTLADLISLYEKFKTLNLEICWFGDINNVLFSLIEAVNLLETIKLNIFTDPSLIDGKNIVFGKNIFLYEEINKKVISNSDCIMTDVFVSMNDKENQSKINLLKKFQVNNDIMQLTSSNTIFMHCLPAKLGIEVTKEVIESSKSIVWQQAYNRLPAQVRLMKCINW